ncbi:hypothetical protein FISHEDRAFT_34031 [Fistulina hepatica ATCC 64428]|uniref:non-specific serine/threonine protein kinase n=1 Tax=Fistulina hepatica ATCC 64428 TaxID=1128425 RepID=A0A0D7AQK2_9AGAR|nr:hypothetical protein FISHEDRAFT_34031 [Fistulina hepatica ATCC 64428]
MRSLFENLSCVYVRDACIERALDAISERGADDDKRNQAQVVVLACLIALVRADGTARDVIERLRRCISQYARQDEANLAHALDVRLAGVPSTALALQVEWRESVRALVQNITMPENIAWMDDDVDDGAYIRRALQDIRSRFSRQPLVDTSPEGRILLADHIFQLPCHLFRCKSADCSVREQGELSCLSACLPLVARLLDGIQSTEVTCGVRRRIYDVLAKLVRHHVFNEGGTSQDEDFMPHVNKTVFSGLVDKDRSVRLAAGRSLKALIEMYSASSNGRVRKERIFNQLYRTMDSTREAVRETMLVSIGQLGRTSNIYDLGQVVCFLVAQLGRQSPVLKGIPAMQMLGIARYHEKSVYALVMPYADQIAPFVVSRICSNPGLLNEACRVMDVRAVDFVSVTLPRTLPQLFGACDVNVLQTIANDLDAKLSSLLMKHSPQILAHIFLLPPSQTNRSLAFVVDVLRKDATRNGSSDVSNIDIPSVIKSCIVPLLVELVVGMGDDHTRDASLTALGKVEAYLAAKTNASPSNDVGAFLKTFMLGIISDINDTLQDVHGKKSLLTKQKILRSLGALISLLGIAVNNVGPQIMATLQTMVAIPELSEVTLKTWHEFLTTLGLQEVGPYIGPTSAAMVSLWTSFTSTSRALSTSCLEFIVFKASEHVGTALDDFVDVSSIPDLAHISLGLQEIRKNWAPEMHLQRILERSFNDNITVATQSLVELKSFLIQEWSFIGRLLSGDMFDPLIGDILNTLFTAAARDGEGADGLRNLSFECIGILGAVDPDRCDIIVKDTTIIMINNFTDEAESVQFALHLIQDLLVDAFRSTSDIKYQSHLAYSIQELLKFCQFGPGLVSPGHGSLPARVRNRWNKLPRHVLETVTPLLEGRFTLDESVSHVLQHPVYPSQATYREWIQLWTSHLISRASGARAQQIFGVFRSSVRNKDVVVAHHLLPHLVLNILISGADADVDALRAEILVVLEDQVNANSSSSPDKKLLSAQAVFSLLDHLNKWVRKIREDINTSKSEHKRGGPTSMIEEQLLRVDSVLSNIDLTLMAKAALQCRAYARSLMSFEQQVISLRSNSPTSPQLPEYYERLHEIYSQLDEPDGMEGVSHLILEPSLENQIRQHESTGRWTSAQSCWEVRLQQSPDDINHHLGLLRCLRNLGHYDSLRTHVSGVLTRNPDWEPLLAGYQVESAWMIGAWDDVERLVSRVTTNQTPQIVLARALLAIRSSDPNSISQALSEARSVLGSPIAAAGIKNYRRAYDAVLDLHLTYELELIHEKMLKRAQSTSPNGRKVMDELTNTLLLRFDSMPSAFRIRESVLSTRRTAYSISTAPRRSELGQSWLASAKIARKAGQWQTAYSAMLQARRNDASLSFIESAKLVKAMGEPLKALEEIEKALRIHGWLDDQEAVPVKEAEREIRAKAQLYRARWMNESERYDFSLIWKIAQRATDLQPNWESGQFHLGRLHDQIFKSLPPKEQRNRHVLISHTVYCYARALKHGSKYVYQTIPRLLTIWLDMGADAEICQQEEFRKINSIVEKAIKETPVYKWYTAFPQIVSRVGHENRQVYMLLESLILRVLEEYPKQALWLFTSVEKSTKNERKRRGREILERLKSKTQFSNPSTARLVDECQEMTNQLLELCDKQTDKTLLSMKKDFPKLYRLGNSSLLIPLQESLTATLPPASAKESAHQPFPSHLPSFVEFRDSVEVIKSLAKPRKITIVGSDGQVYMFLGKPKDDLRKDARLMDFNAIINKLLKANSESRRRQLYIRTYGVVTLNEECGFIQWVPKTIPLRTILLKRYSAHGIPIWVSDLCGVAHLRYNVCLNITVFHEWFLETFPEPTAWFASRLAYARTLAVMSMVGYILGLGDRHCENILLDITTGDVVHVDFNCLFDKGKTLEVPERVPFRLTQNLIDGLGVTGIEGVFRIACEVTFQLLRDNKDSLMSVLDAFIHDPLVEWEDEKRRQERRGRHHNQVKINADLLATAKNALNPIERKLKGIVSRQNTAKEANTGNVVQSLIQDATNAGSLARMYPGWAPWH